MDLALLWQWTNCSWAVGTTRLLLCLMRQPVYIPPCFSTLGDTSLFHYSIPAAGVNTPACIFMGFIPVKFLSLNFFFLYNRSQNKVMKPFLRKLGNDRLEGSCSALLQEDSASCWRNGKKTLSNCSPVITLALQEVPSPSPISLNTNLPVQIYLPTNIKNT